MVAVALIFAACDGDSGNNGTGTESGRSSSGEIFSSGGQLSGFSSSSDLSSVNTSSSSSIAVCSNVYGTNTVTDCRDGRIYKTVAIGTQTWMAENLNYADSLAMSNLKGNSWCYENSVDSCAKYGRLYTWTGAMNLASSYQSEWASSVISTPQQGVCPTGWHVPTDAEWTTLVDYLGGFRTAGAVLKSTGGWNEDGNGTDAYGFLALPAGKRDYDGDFGGGGYYAYFWCAPENGAFYAYYRFLSHDSAYMGLDNTNKYHAFSVRCVKD